MRYTKYLGKNPQATMTTKEKLLQEIEQSPETLLQEVLGFLMFTRNTRYTQPHKPILASSPRTHGRCPT